MPAAPEPRRAIVRTVLDHELPGPLYAAVGLVDRVKHEVASATIGDVISAGIQVPVSVAATAWRLTASVSDTPRALTAAAQQEYDDLVDRGQVRSVEIAAERAVRKRVSRFEDHIAPRAARATVRWNSRRQRWAASRAARRAAEARLRAQRAARRFSEFNAPVLAEEPEHRAEP